MMLPRKNKKDAHEENASAIKGGKRRSGDLAVEIIGRFMSKCGGVFVL
jgi:hypothetical protein